MLSHALLARNDVFNIFSFFPVRVHQKQSFLVHWIVWIVLQKLLCCFFRLVRVIPVIDTNNQKSSLG